MKTKQEIEERLNGLYEKYLLVYGDMLDPELEAQMRELRWVLDGE
jgi:UDP-2,3-diacylglucosamine pyrophosphatase LpxH